MVRFGWFDLVDSKGRSVASQRVDPGEVGGISYQHQNGETSGGTKGQS